MKRTISAALTLALLMLSSSFPLAAADAPDLRIGNYTLVGKTRVSPYLWNLSYRASLTNRGTSNLNGARADLRLLLDFLVADGQLNFGPVAAGQTVTSLDTFTLRSPFGQPIDPRLLERYLRWNITIAGTAPIANAGPDQTVALGGTASLDGRGSSDADGDRLTYRWALTAKPSGSVAALAGADTATPSFVADRPGSYDIALIVNDGQRDSAPDTVQVRTANSTPVADAGADQAAIVGDTVTFDGSGSHDADGDSLTFAWSLTAQPAGSTAAIHDGSGATTTFVPDREGDYVIQLVVDDGRLASAPDTATVRVSSPPPPPNHDPQINSVAVTTGQSGVPYQYQVVAADPDGDPLTYGLTVAPTGMVIGTGGLIEWTPGAEGRFDVTVSVSDGRGGTVTQSFSIAVAPAAGVPPPTVVVDPEVPIEIATIPGFDGGPARAVVALTDRSNVPAHFVADELIVVSDDTAAVEDLAARYGGTLLRSFVPADHGLPGAAQHLIRIDPGTVDPSGLAADLHQLEPDSTNALRISNEAGLRLLAAAARENVEGMQVGLNLVMLPDGFEDRVTIEHGNLTLCPSTPATPPGIDRCVFPLIGGNEDFKTNAFLWSYMGTGSGTQNIGVGEAWRSLSLAGLLGGTKVPIAVIDGGFFPTAPDNPVDTQHDDNSLFDDVGFPPNEGSCTDGASCPWHGVNVVSAAMGPADDGKGAAGPGGPVARAITIRFAGDQFSMATAFGIAVTRGARIINMSFHVRQPATLSFAATPFNAVTAGAHALGVLIIAASGNNGQDVDSEDCLPPADTPCWEDAWYMPCENDGVFCVGALADQSSTAASFSNYGAEDVDLYAPGNVWVGGDPVDPEPHTFLGTSGSAPFVAGVAALVMAADPRLFGDDVENILARTALPGGDDKTARGYVNAQGAVNFALGGSPVCTPPTILTSTAPFVTVPCIERVFEVTHSQAFGPFRYQWRKLIPGTTTRVDLVDGDNVSGSTTARLTINPFRPGDEGMYDVVVSNLCGSATSGLTTVSVTDGTLERAPSLLQPRSQVGMSFDRGRGRMVLFGGRTSDGDFEGSSETWERDGNGAWQVVATQGPGRRFDSFMAYDEARGVTVLFGGTTCGQQCGNYEDTWEWNGTTWTERPAAGFGSATRTMTYDSVRRRVVRFDFQYNVLEWNGTDWTRRVTSMDPVNGSPSPSATNSAVTFDRNRNVYVLQTHIDTWELDGSGQWWLRKRPDTFFGVPFFTERNTMAFDSDRNRTLLYSGAQLGNNIAEGRLWEWTGSTWLHLPVGHLPVNTYPHLAMAYDSARRRTVLTGVGYPPFISPSLDVFEWRYFTPDPTCSLGPQ